MDDDIYPRFLQAKAFGNLTPISSLVRLTLGLLALWAALATGFSFIFLDVHRRKRLWVSAAQSAPSARVCQGSDAALLFDFR